MSFKYIHRKLNTDAHFLHTILIVSVHEIDIALSLLFTGSYEMAQFQSAVAEWNRYTCLNIRPAIRTDRNYINVSPHGG